jgi:NTP pyrophosphatase (non-canonical NTP hydrolase)
MDQCTDPNCRTCADERIRLSEEAAANRIADGFIAQNGFLTFSHAQNVNFARAHRWRGDTRAWTLLEVTGELCGEAGEAANVAKKILRFDLAMRGNESSDHPASEREALVGLLRREVADVIIVALRLASEAGIDLDAAVREKFNATSEKMGFPERL